MTGPIVLVHGGGFAASCWDRLVPLLPEPVVALDLPGRGSRPAPLVGLTIGHFVDAVVDTLEADDLRDVTLVGHSLAGHDLATERLQLRDECVGQALRATTYDRPPSSPRGRRSFAV